MVEYKCLRCGYSNNNKSVFKRHITRKFICEPKLKDISIKYIYKKYFKNSNKIEDYDDPQKPSKNPQNSLKNPHFPSFSLIFTLFPSIWEGKKYQYFPFQ